MDSNYSLDVNRRHWDARAEAHASSPDYEVDRFLADPTHLSDVVRFDRPLLGDVSDLRAVHLQCHIGTDTVSLARLGARMTGLDFSRRSLDQAEALARRTATPIDFVHSTVAAALDALEPKSFDLVYTGIGALCWLPHIDVWAHVVAGLLAPGGRLFVREGHPVLWALDYERTDGILALEHPYFETADPVVDTTEGTYVTVDTAVSEPENHTWNHALGEIVTALLAEGLAVTGLVEHACVPWNPLPAGHLDQGDDGQWRLRDRADRLPLTFTLQAVSPSVP